MTTAQPNLSRRLVAECIGTAFLLAAVVGSGIMGERLSGGNVAMALLANTIATGATLVALILALGPVSGAHLNPAVSVADAALGGLPWGDVPGYLVAQILGAFVGVGLADLMFDLPAFTASTSFANPAVTLARAATDTFAGIRPADVPGFLIAQMAGAAAAAAVVRWLVPADESRAR